MTVEKVLMIEDIAAPRPEDIPAHWEVYNAPRPMYGHERWQGDFRHGIFYVAIDPEGDYADEYRQRTLQNDGHLCVWVTRDEVIEWAKGYCEKYGIDPDCFGYQDFVTSYVRHSKRGG